MKRLSVPVKIPLRWEAWRGFGLRELLRTLTVFLPVTVLALLLCLILSSEWTALITAVIGILSFAGAALAFQRMDNNVSVYDYMKRIGAYRRSQKTYYYRKKEVNVHVLSEEA